MSRWRKQGARKLHSCPRRKAVRVFGTICQCLFLCLIFTFLHLRITSFRSYKVAKASLSEIMSKGQRSCSCRTCTAAALLRRLSSWLQPTDLLTQMPTMSPCDDTRHLCWELLQLLSPNQKTLVRYIDVIGELFSTHKFAYLEVTSQGPHLHAFLNPHRDTGGSH